MTLEKAMTIAAEHAKRREYDDALYVLRQILETNQDHAGIIHSIGAILSNKGEIQAGFDALLKAARLSPQSQFLFPLLKQAYNLRAFDVLEQVCREFNDDVIGNSDLLSIWGASRLQRKKYAEALELIEVGLSIDPRHSDLLHHASVALLNLGRLEESVQAFAKRSLPYVEHQPQDLSKTVKSYAELAENYDRNTLHQTFSRKLVGEVQRALPLHVMTKVLDLGCGTGAIGTNLPNTVLSLVGVDVSADMLGCAKQKEKYTELILGDFLLILPELSGGFDAVLSSGVLYHFADLAPIFLHSSRVLTPGGVFAFSVDPMTDDQDIAISYPGEYCHSRAYLRKLAGLYGFVERSITIDIHRGAPGFWCVFQKV